MNPRSTHDLPIGHEQIGEAIRGGGVTPGEQSNKLVAASKQLRQLLSLSAAVARGVSLGDFCLQGREELAHRLASGFVFSSTRVNYSPAKIILHPRKC